MYNQPAEEEEDYDPTVEDPFILLGPPLHHSDCIATDAQRIRHTVQPSLCSLQHFPLLSQIPQNSSSSVKKLI